MATSTPEQPTTAVATRTLADQLADRGVAPAQWHVLTKSLYPGARIESALMVLDYCAARKLDPMKKPCHIVPMKVKVGEDYEWRDVVLPGIYEYRTTAMRTGLYLGHTAPEYGPLAEFAGVTAPEWCAMTFKRAAKSGVVIEFPVRVYFREVCNTKDEWVDKKRTGKVLANDRWAKAPIQMLTKCTEAAGLREAFPDEFGGEQTFEEMAGATGPIDDGPASQPVKAAQRVSQQQASEPAAATTAAPAAPEQPATHDTAPAGAPAHIGQITEVNEKGSGALIVLSTGYLAATKDGDIIRAAAGLRDAKTLVELSCRPSSDPAKYAPIVETITPVGEDA